MRCKGILLVLGIGLLLGGCKSERNDITQEEAKDIIEEKNDVSEAKSGKNKTWASLIKNKDAALKDLYTENAIKIIDSDNILEGNQAISDYHIASTQPVKEIWINTITDANVKRGIKYEVGGFFDVNGDKYDHVIIWEGENEERKRSFEFIAKHEKTTYSLSEISKRRDDWIIYCNKHNAADLINEMYSANTLYFNHKPLVKGRKDLIQEYAYMNNEKYSLSLSPIHVLPVNQNFVFEIGQCQGSYNGKYIIIWKRNAEGKWEVYIDSNI